MSLRGVQTTKQSLPMRQKQYCVYIMTNKTHSVLYVGVTSDLMKRDFQHKEKFGRF